MMYKDLNNTEFGIFKVEFDNLKNDVKELKKIYDIVNRQTIATEKLALEMRYMREDQDKVEKRVKVLEDKPVKRFDNIITQLLGAIIGAIVGAISVLIGLSK